MYNQKLMKNPLKTKTDAQNALLEILTPLKKYFKTSKYGLMLENGGSLYEERTREIEAVLRPLWGVIPFLVGGGDYPDLAEYMKKIKAGVDPNSESYWGQISGTDQRMVEMAVLATGLCLARKKFWDEFSSEEQENLYQWLNQINDYDTPANNWRFFRILTNLGFKNCGVSYNKEQMESDLKDINSYYLNDGWYVDGNPNQIDYYVPFAIHFYALIYVKAVGDEDLVYAPLFKERAVKFARTFKSFFTDDGEAVPFGRSMTYRFAQSAFWGALAFADVEALPWGEIKHLCLQNLRHWFGQDIFTASGELTIGYYYRNLIMAEGYNAFGSPYWALKAFIFLSIPEEHPFWTVAEIVPEVPEQLVISEARSIICRDERGAQVQLFPVGQHCAFTPAHADSKYEKFVYSTTFGFSVSKGAIGLGHGAFDSTLAVSENDDYYRMRFGVQEYKIKEDYLSSIWKPWDDVSIQTYIIPMMPWHVRIHFVKTRRNLSLAEGGFSINTEGEYSIIKTNTGIAYQREVGEISGVVNLLNFVKYEIIYPEANTNLNYPRTALPTLMAELEPGTYVLASAVLGTTSENQALENVPSLIKEGNVWLAKGMNKQVEIIL